MKKVFVANWFRKNFTRKEIWFLLVFVLILYKNIFSNKWNDFNCIYIANRIAKPSKISPKTNYPNKMPEHERFYQDKVSESDDKFASKSQVYSSVVMPHLKSDNAYHRNSDKNVGYIKTSSGSIITFVPFSQDSAVLPAHVQPRARPRVASSKTEPMIPYDGNHLKIKLHNPMNQLRRNQSHLTQFFS